MTHLDSEIVKLEAEYARVSHSGRQCRFDSTNKQGYNSCVNMQTNEAPAIRAQLDSIRANINDLNIKNIHLQMVEEAHKIQTIPAIPPGDVSKMTQTNDALKLGAVILGLLVLSS